MRRIVAAGTLTRNGRAPAACAGASSGRPAGTIFSSVRREVSCGIVRSIAPAHYNGMMSVPLIQFENVTIQRGDRIVLDGIHLSIAQGEHVAILGPNGS